MAAGTFTRLNGKAQMRKVSTLLGLPLVALASTARAQDAAPVATPPSPPASAPLATEAPASASDATAAHHRWPAGLSIFPMVLGRFNSTPGRMKYDQPAAITYSAGFNINYEVQPRK